MNEPKRLSSESESPLERAMLDAWRTRAPRAGKERALAAAAAVAGTGLAGGKAAAGVALVKAGSAGWAKWLGIVGIAGAGALAGGAIREHARSIGPSPAATALPASQDAPGGATSRSGAVTAVADTPAESVPPEAVAPLQAAPATSATAGGANEPAAPPAASSPSRRAAAAEVPGGSTMPEELSWLERAKGAMAAGEPAQALSLLDAYTAHFTHPGMLPEATVLRIEALLDGGDRAAAERVASAFVAAHPQSPYAPRIRSLLAGSNR
jgi:hypothetical protein